MEQFRRHQQAAGRARRTRLLAMSLVLGTALGLRPAAAGTPAGGPAHSGRVEPVPTGEIHRLLTEHRFPEIYRLAAAELDSLGIGVARKLELLRATAAAHLIESLAGGEPGGREKAVAAMKAMLALDGQADFVPGWRYPPPVHTLFQEVRQSWRAGRDLPADPRRIAVAPFYVIDMGGGEKINWEGFAQALPFILTADLQAVPGLTLLSREQMDAIRAELSLASQSELVSQANRIRLHELLSAASFVYGELQVLPGDEVLFELRWVQTETGTTLLARHGQARIRSGGDLLDLEESVVIDDFIPAMVAVLMPASSLSWRSSNSV